MPGIFGPPLYQIPEDGLGLVVAPETVQGVGQLVRGQLGPEGPGDRKGPDHLVGPARAGLIEPAAERVVDQGVAGIGAGGAAEHGDARIDFSRVGE